MTDDYAIPVGDTGHEPGTFLMVLTALRPFTLYETTKGWRRELPEKPEDGQLIESYSKIEWIFADDEGQTGSGNTSTARGESSTLFKWATGLGLPPAVVLDRSQPIPASQLVGREAMVTFAPDKNGYNRISSVVPAPRARAAAQPPAANTEAVSQPAASAVPPQVPQQIVPPQPVAPNPTPSPSEVGVGVGSPDDLPFI